MSDGELLVLLTGLPDLDTAQVLLARAGGLYGLARMSVPELRRLVRGVGPQRAAAIRAAIEFGKRVAMTSGFDRLQVKDPNTIGQMLQLDMGALDQEELRVVALDTKQRILCVDTVYVGSLNCSLIRVGELFKGAIRRNAACAILAHNHPSGDPQPSPEDLFITREAVQAGQLLDIDIIDHIVVASGGFISLRERYGDVWSKRGM